MSVISTENDIFAFCTGMVRLNKIMRKTYLLFVVLFVAAQVVISASCNDVAEEPATVKSNNKRFSHEFSSDCFSCHKPGGTAKTIFTVAGSMLDETRSLRQTQCRISLYTKPNGKGSRVATLYADSSGNFYTDQHIDFSKGLYPVLYGNPDAVEPVKYMSTPVFTGACGTCHGEVTERLGIN